MYWLRADRRIDYVFVTPTRRDRRGSVHEARLIFETPLVMAGGERLFASDHYGVLVEGAVPRRRANRTSPPCLPSRPARS